MALNYETLIRAASKPPEQRTTTEVNDFIFPWLKQSLKKKQGIFQKISDDVIHDICKSIMLEQRPAWDVVIRQGDPGDTFYIILQGSVNIYRLDDDAPRQLSLDFDPIKELSKPDLDPDKREELISQAFGNYIVTLAGGFDFGERALITNEPRSATVMTITPTDLLVLDREVFSRTLKTAHEKELQEKTEFINRCPLFSSWSARLKRLVSLNLERGRFSYDGVLFKQGSRADAVYFIWNGEVKLTMDPLLHWLQYPSLLPQADPNRQRALDLFLPSLNISSASNVNGHRESYVIKRRHMTFAQAEKERHQRIIQLALLGTGDIVGLDAFVCDLPTYMNSARCTAPCDLFYILKHNFVRLQKRHGTQGLTERLRDMVRLSIQAYPNRIAHLPLYTVLMKKQLATVDEDEQQQYHAKHSWLLHVNHQKKSNSRRSPSRSIGSPGKSRQPTAVIRATPIRSTVLEDQVSFRYAISDRLRVGQVEDRLKQWHAQLGETSKTQIRPLTRYTVTTESVDGNIRLLASTNPIPTDNQSDVSFIPSSTSGETFPSETLVQKLHPFSSRESTHVPVLSSASQHANLPTIKKISTKKQHEDCQLQFQRKLREFNRRIIPNLS